MPMNTKEPMAPKAPDDITNQRLMDLEIKASFAEDLLDHLNQIVSEQQQRIDVLIDLVAQLKRDRNTATPESDLGMDRVANELPPHY
jgi:SlyX protein